MKKALVLILVVMLVIPAVVLGVSVHAELNKDGDVYLIGSAADLVEFKNTVNAAGQNTRFDAKLTADIDMSSVTDWTPIGSHKLGNGSLENDGYLGIFDGDGHTISNLNVTMTSANCGTSFNTGLLFGVLANGGGVNAEVKNFTLKDSSLTLSGTKNNEVFAGGICNNINRAKIINVTLDNVDITASGFLGGVIGLVSQAGTWDPNLIDQCEIKGTCSITTDSKGVGCALVCGRSNNSALKITNCTVAGTITAPEGARVMAYCAYLNSDSDFTGTTTSTGYTLFKSGSYTAPPAWDYYAEALSQLKGNVLNDKIIVPSDDELTNPLKDWGERYIKNLFDIENNGLFKTKYAGTFTSPLVIPFTTTEPVTVKSYALTTGNDTAGAPGRNAKSWIFEGSADGQNYYTIDSVDNGGLLAVNDTAFVFNVANPAEYQYYRLTITSIVSSGGMQHDSFIILDAHTDLEVEEQYTEISSAEELKAIYTEGSHIVGNYRLTADITVTEALSYKKESDHFKGVFDGNGHTITLDLHDTDWARFALFCSAGGCTIKNLNVTGTVDSTGNSTGALIGTVKGAGEVLFDNVNVDVTIKGGSSLGQAGFIGCIEDNDTVVTFKNCTCKGSIENEVAGGFIGVSKGSLQTITFENCTNESSVLVTNAYSDNRGAGGFIGAISGSNTTVTFKNCINKGSITTTFVSAGAFIGSCRPNAIVSYTECSNEGNVLSGGVTITSYDKKNICVSGDAGTIELVMKNHQLTLTGSPKVYTMPASDQLSGAKFYLNGVEFTGDAEIKDAGNSKLEFNVYGITEYDSDHITLTVVLPDGQYGTWGLIPLKKAQIDTMILTDTLYTLTEIPVAGFDNQSGFGNAANLFDSNNDNKLEGNKTRGNDVVIYFNTAYPVKIGCYGVGTAGDDTSFSGRQPNTWTLYASENGVDYVALDTRTDRPLLLKNNTLYLYESGATKAYQYYKFVVSESVSEATNSNAVNYFQFGQLRIYEAEKDEELDITSVSSTLQSTFAFNFKASGDFGAYKSVYALATVNGNTYRLDQTSRLNVFTLRGIAPDKLGDKITVTVYGVKDDDVEVPGKTVSISVADYINALLEEYDDEKLQTLLVDILNYGAAAQAYTGHNTDALVNAGLTDDQKAYGTQDLAELDDDEAVIRIVDGATVAIKSVSLILNDGITIRYTVEGNLEGVKFRISDGKVYSIVTAKQVGESYVVDFKGVTADKMRSVFRIVALDQNDQAVSDTVAYSVATYARAFSNDATVGALVTAMMKYGDSAAAFAAAAQ